MDNSEFFQALFEKCEGCAVSLMTLPGKQITHYNVEDLAKFSGDAVRLGTTENTYFSVWPRREGIPVGVRGGSDDTRYMTCLFADCDIFGPAHKAAGLPPSKEVVLNFLQKMEKPPTVIVDSGYGLYPFWMLSDPILLADEVIRDKASGILRGYGNYLIREFRKREWALDNVFDPARMLRAPGSNNYKLENPAPCRILWESGIFYALEDFVDYYEAAAVVKSEPFSVDERVIGSAQRIMDGCLFTQKMRDEPDSVTEPEWKAICSNVVLTPDGAEKFHEWSASYSGYNYDETALSAPICVRHLRKTGFHTPNASRAFRSVGILKQSWIPKASGAHRLRRKFKALTFGQSAPIYLFPTTHLRRRSSSATQFSH